MWILPIVEFLKYKIVGSVIVLTCLPYFDRAKLIKDFSRHGLSATCSCDAHILEYISTKNSQGVLYFVENYNILNETKSHHFSLNYKWLIVGNEIPNRLHTVRYDADITLFNYYGNGNSDQVGYFQDIYIHPEEGASVHPWAYWSNGIILTHEVEKKLRRRNLKKFPMRIATPIAQYSEDWYNGTFRQYLADERLSELDSAIRCAHGASALLIEHLNATEVLVPTLLWSTVVSNDSMMVELYTEKSVLAGAVLRMMPSRFERLDYVLPIWPFSVGFTYLAERESSSNMYVEPFATVVWWSCLAIGLVLTAAQWLTSRSQLEKDGACITVLASWLQQDASAVPEGISGRWTFIVLSVSSMLVHAYYTSAIVSALMSTGRSGPDSLRSLADSRYSIASEDYDYMRYLMFDIKTNWEDLEYLKEKKITAKFYQDIEKGVKLIEDGNTAFHAEYNQIYPYFKRFSDDNICKLQHVDTIPESISWVTTTKRGQWTHALRCSSRWLHETGLSKRLVSKLRVRRPACRTSLLAERVKFGDVAPLLCLTMSGAILSLLLLGLEILYAKWAK
ncbi:uncharacterized protein LOC101735556 [Bombyx mori]|uniref:uncharacterized protein LOC101735556 n=1 Tax=Bombyx mori TaxID=7091 RepID=UPI002ED36CDB